MPGTFPLNCPPVGPLEIELSLMNLPGGDAVVNSTSPFNINVVFTAAGVIVPFLQTFSIPLTVSMAFESIGPGPELIMGIIAFNFNAGFVPSVVCVDPNAFDYNLVLAVPVGTLPVGTPGHTAAVTIPGFPIIAHTDGPVISSI